MAKKNDAAVDILHRATNILGLVKSPTQRNYDLVTKKIAIELLASSEREYRGEHLPTFLETSELLQIPESTLRNWWGKKKEIECQANAAFATLPRQISLMLITEVYNIVTILKEKGYDSVSVRDLTQLLKVYVTSSRLLGGQSTSNVAVNFGNAPAPVK